jgi:cytidylate kinase
MKIDLKKYMTERDSMRDQQNVPGPVVTISRQYGCEANQIAHLLIHKIAESAPHSNWKMINKEIIDESASVLGLTPNRVEQRVLGQARSTIEDVFSSLSHHYSMTDKTIVETVREIIETYAKMGHVVIIGRGGSSLIRKIETSLHIRLMAPDEWRVQKMMTKNDITENNAYTIIQKVDVDRKLWAEHLSNEPFNDGLFDLIFNRKTLTNDEIVDTIIRLMQDRKMLN